MIRQKKYKCCFQIVNLKGERENYIPHLSLTIDWIRTAHEWLFDPDEKVICVFIIKRSKSK